MINERQAKRYCYEPEQIENYDKAIADKEHTWHCHHRVETIMNCGRNELMAQGCYYDRPAHDLIFLTKEAHMRLHLKGNKIHLGKCGYKFSEEHRRKLSEAQKGKKGYWLGKPHSEETKNKLSESLKEYWANRRAKA